MLHNIDLPPNTSAEFKKYLAEFDEIAEDFKKLNTTSYVKTLEMDEFEKEAIRVVNNTNRTLTAFDKHCDHPVKHHNYNAAQNNARVVQTFVLFRL